MKKAAACERLPSCSLGLMLQKLKKRAVFSWLRSLPKSAGGASHEANPLSERSEWVSEWLGGGLYFGQFLGRTVPDFHGVDAFGQVAEVEGRLLAGDSGLGFDQFAHCIENLDELLCFG